MPLSKLLLPGRITQTKRPDKTLAVPLPAAPDNPPILFTEAENSLGPFKDAPLRSPPKQLTKITSMVQHRDSSRSAFPNNPPRTCPEQLQYALFLLLLLFVSETLEPVKFSSPTNACNKDVLGEHRSMGTFGRRGAVREH